MNGCIDYKNRPPTYQKASRVGETTPTVSIKWEVDGLKPGEKETRGEKVVIT